MSNPLVSVIVPTKNSEKFLEACLDSIKNQTYKNIELIVVDNFSTDRTQEIARKYTDKVFSQGPERSAQVNYGVEQASGEYVYKVDSDFVLDPKVVEECVEEMQKGFDAIVVHNSPDVRVSWIAKIRKFEVDMYKYDLTHSSARFVKKEVYKKIGGFNPAITAGEDYDFQNKLNRGGFKTGFVEAEALHLGEPTRFWEHMRKYYAYGKDFVNYQRENRDESRQQLSIFRSVYIKNWKSLVKHPATAGAFIFYNVLKFSAGGIGYFFGLMNQKEKGGDSVDKCVTRIIFSPHYDDAVFSLGGMIASYPKDCVVVTVFTGVPKHDAKISSWDLKCGFTNAENAMTQRSVENNNALTKLGLTRERIIDLGILGNGYADQLTNCFNICLAISDHLQHHSENLLQAGNIEIYAPFHTHHEEHKLTRDAAIEFALQQKTCQIYLYEDMPYHILPQSMLNRNDYRFVKSIQKGFKIFSFTNREWILKREAIQAYKSQLNAMKYAEIMIFTYTKIIALLQCKPHLYTEKAIVLQLKTLKSERQLRV